MSPDDSYFTCIKNMKLVTKKFKSGGLHEKHVQLFFNVIREHIDAFFPILVLVENFRRNTKRARVFTFVHEQKFSPPS